jgi:hypothetical protein
VDGGSAGSGSIAVEDVVVLDLTEEEEGNNNGVVVPVDGEEKMEYMIDEYMKIFKN